MLLSFILNRLEEELDHTWTPEGIVRRSKMTGAQTYRRHRRQVKYENTWNTDLITAAENWSNLGMKS
jgi:hypothetical protein